MPTVAPSPTCRHTTIRIETEHPTQFIDITTDLEAFVAACGIWSGLLNVQSLHTTAAIVVNEHEPLLLTDMAGLLKRLAPVDAVYRHDNITLRTVNCVLDEHEDATHRRDAGGVPFENVTESREFPRPRPPA